jgi:predicted CoA-binding protein
MDDALQELLTGVRSIAVVGIKAGAEEDAFRVPRYLQGQGYRILPVSPKLDRVLGQRCVPDLDTLDEVPDLVNLFRAPVHVPGHVDEILAVRERSATRTRPLAVWMQLGIRHPEAAARLEAEGITVVQDRCLMVEHARLLRRDP